MLLYHLSDKILDSILYPKVPENFLTKLGVEDNKTPRVCFCPSIGDCLKAMSAPIKGKIFHVYITHVKDPYKPTIKEVPDCEVTKECWSTQPTRIQRIYDIKVLNTKKENPKNVYTYGDNKAQLFDWHYVILPNWYKDLFKFNNHLNTFKYDRYPDFDFYTIKDAYELEETKIGICWDYVVDEASWLESKGISYDCYYTNLVDKKGSTIATHTYILIPWKGKNIYFESSWEKYKGLYFISSYKVVEKILKKQFGANKAYTTKYLPLESVGCTDKEFFKYLIDFGVNPYEQI